MTDNQQSTTTENKPRTLNEFFENVRVAWSLFRDNRVNPLLRFGVPLAVIAYIILPIDLLPDVLPGLGQLDDIAAIWLGLTYFLSACPPEIVAEYRDGASAATPSATPDPNVVDGDYRVVND